MSKIIEDMLEEVRQETSRAIARNLIEMKELSFESIAKTTGLSMEEVKHLAQNKSA